MDELLEQLASEPMGRLVIHYVATCGLWNCYVLVLVASRLAGVFVVAPFFKTNTIPLFVRAVLVVLLSLIVAPTVSSVRPVESDIAQASHDSAQLNVLPASPSDLACVIAIEIGLGSLLGTGLIAVLSGLRLGGEWLDRHSGLGLATALNPEWTAGESACGSLAQWLGIAAFLLIEPISGQWLILQSLVQSFHAIPLGSASWSLTGIELLNGLVQQSLVLGLRIAMPLIVTMMLVDMALGFAGRGTPLPLNSPCLILRTFVGLIVLALTMTTIPDVIATTMVSTLEIFQLANP